jgi:hypothetical protein
VWHLTKDACNLSPPNLSIGSRAASEDGLSGSVMMGGTMVTTVSPATMSMAASRAYGSDPALRADPAGAALSRWEIDPSLIKNPGNSLGTGSFGTVFRAELHGKDVAVKKLSTQKFDEKTLEEFRKEVAIMRYSFCLMLLFALNTY